mgnify:CR=1 FL=1
MSKKANGWDKQGAHRTPAFYRQALSESQRKSREHWNSVTQAQAASGVRDPGVWSATALPPRIRGVNSKFEEVSHVTKHAEQRTRQRKLRPGTRVHTVMDDRTGTLITAWAISSSIVQNRSTLASSKGASTSSNTQIGAGFVRKTANSKASAVNACSPPDKSDMICSFFPGGLAIISNPAFRGSSASVN